MYKICEIRDNKTYDRYYGTFRQCKEWLANNCILSDKDQFYKSKTNKTDYSGNIIKYFLTS